MSRIAVTVTVWGRSRRGWLRSVVLLRVAVAALGSALGSVPGSGLDDRTAPPAGAPPLGYPPPVPSGAPGGTKAPAGLAHSVPVGLRIPAIGVSVPLSLLGLNADGTVQVPANYADAGWFRLGPSPGEVGSAVILGHVDSTRGPAVFFRLDQLRAGDLVEVDLADGVLATFVVVAVAMYPKDSFPAAQVYGSHGFSALQLVTCGGVFDRTAHSYRSNVVVYTSLVIATTVPAGQPA